MANVVITGASSGIGEATARLLAAKGHALALVARRKERLDLIAREIAAGGRGAKVEVIGADLSDPGQVERAVEEAVQRLGAIDVWVNNAGIGQGRPRLWELSPAELERVIAVDLTAPILACRAVLPHMMARGRGHIINVVSVAGHIGTSPVYSAAKFGLRGFSEALRRQVAGRGIKVSIVSPGLIRTPMTEGVRFRMPGPDRVARVIERLIRRPRREVVVPAWYRGVIVLNRALPAVADRVAMRIYLGLREER